MRPRSRTAVTPRRLGRERFGEPNDPQRHVDAQRRGGAAGAQQEDELPSGDPQRLRIARGLTL